MCFTDINDPELFKARFKGQYRAFRNIHPYTDTWYKVLELHICYDYLFTTLFPDECLKSFQEECLK